MRLYGLAGLFILVGSLLFIQLPNGNITTAHIWIPVTFSFCIIASVFCIGAEIFECISRADRRADTIRRLHPLERRIAASLSKRRTGPRRKGETLRA